MPYQIIPLPPGIYSLEWTVEDELEEAYRRANSAGSVKRAGHPGGGAGVRITGPMHTPRGGPNGRS
jgi:hypothetical protein